MFCSTTLAIMTFFGFADPAVATGLSAHVGKYPFEPIDCISFFEEPLVTDAISKAAGEDALDFVESLDAASPVTKQEDALIAVACEDGACDKANAALAITTDGKLVALCLYAADGGHGADPGITRWITKTHERKISPHGSEVGCPHESDQFLNAYANARF